jgi:hypothetical protein
MLTPNVSTSLQTLAAEAHITQGQLLWEQTLNKAKSLLCRAGTTRPTVSKREGQNLEPG